MYIKKYTPELLKLINNSLQNKEYELEARLKDSFNIINNEVFYNILKRLKGNPTIKHIDDTETLDISVGDLRFTIIGKDNIIKICQTNNISLINNKYIQVIKKNVIKNIDINEYKLRMSLKKEEPISLTSKNIVGIINRWKHLDKTYRYKKRASFSTSDNMFRFDLTILRSSNKKKNREPNRIFKKRNIKPYHKKSIIKPSHITDFNEWFDKLKDSDNVELMGKIKYDLISTKNIQKSNVLKNNMEYEVELEFVGNKLSQLKKTKDTDKTILIKMLQNISLILQMVQKSYYIISEQDKSMVINEYKQKMNDFRFKAPMNVTLEKRNIIERNYEDYPNMVSIRKGYSVTDKADGERNLLIVLKNGDMYLMNRKNNIKDIGANCTELADSIFDCEYIVKDRDHNNINLLMVFDIYFYKNDDVRDKILIRSEEEKKEGKISVSRYELLTEAIDNINENLKVKTNNTLQIIKKRYNLGDDDIYSKEVEDKITILENELIQYQPDNARYDQIKTEIKDLKCDTKIFSVSKKLYEKNYIYKIDGLIFTPRSLFVGEEPDRIKKNNYEGRWYRSFKWKPPEQNSIDFLVKIVKDENDSKKDLIKYVTMNGEIVPYKTLNLMIGYNPNIHTKHNSCRILNENIIFEEKYDMVPFHPTEPYIKNSHIANIPITDNNILTLEDQNIINDNMIIECVYDDSNPYFKWKPIRLRDNPQPNDFLTAVNVWNCIHNPITLEMITTGNIEKTEDDIYYNQNLKRKNKKCVSMYDFHSYIKKQLIVNNSHGKKNLLDLSVGRGGDINHWIDANINIMVGIDICKEGLTNENGVCNRILTKSIEHKKILGNYYIIWGDSSKNLLNSDGGKDELHKYYLDIIYGNILDDNIKSSKLNKIYNIGNIDKGNGFDVVSSQFSIHYYFKNMDTIMNFLNNVSQSLKKGGRFIGTCLNGSLIFDELKDTEYISSLDEETLLWKITKKYKNTEFHNDERSLGIKIDVYNESIGVSFTEYLVNFEYLISLCKSVNLKLVENRNFLQIYTNMPKDMDYGRIKDMNDDLKKYSFLNNAFVFEKV